MVMTLSDIIPKTPIGIYCEKCGTPTVLGFDSFEDTVGGVDFDIKNIPFLACLACKHRTLTDRARGSICTLHFKAQESGQTKVSIHRRKPLERFAFAKHVHLQYDSDDYYYLPGLWREVADGYLTPVFFNKQVLLKFSDDRRPEYQVRMCSKSYGTIWKDDDYSIPFGINRSGKVIMWLGDIDRLPENEQRFLLSENIASDHDIGSEFYDGQIEAIFTERKPEDRFFGEWLELMSALETRFGFAIDRLREESLAAMDELVPPVSDVEVDILGKYAAFNELTIETLSKDKLWEALQKEGIPISKSIEALGTLKLLEQVALSFTRDASRLLAPLFVMYDLRVVKSHRFGTESRTAKLASAATRVGLSADATSRQTYDAFLAVSEARLRELTMEIAKGKPQS